jgi:hypothetical protein
LAKYLARTLVKYLVGIPIAKYLADRLPALEGIRDIIGLIVPPITIAIFPKLADLLDNIEYYNILAIYNVDFYINRIKLYSILTIGLGILAKYIYNILIIIAIYSI